MAVKETSTQTLRMSLDSVVHQLPVIPEWLTKFIWDNNLNGADPIYATWMITPFGTYLLKASVTN